MQKSPSQAQAWTTRATPIIPPARRADLMEEALDAEALLIDGRSEQVHRLNETAVAVWRCCDGETTNDRMADRLVDDYDVAYADALDHVDQLIARFAALHLLADGARIVHDETTVADNA